MNEIQNFVQRLEAEKENCLKNADALLQDARADEANFEKIRANIFGIAASVCRASGSQSPDQAVVFVQSKLSHISQEWAKSLAVAEQFGDHAKAAIERLKLKTIAEVDAPLAAISEGKQ